MLNRLYIHIPFCQRKCPYCAFVSQQGNASDISAYVELLLEEMRIVRLMPAPLQSLDSIYFGGGTPSLLHPDHISRLLEQADKSFGISENAEITLEANPGTVNLNLLTAFRNTGVNRLSIGVQSFNEQMLKILGRIHSADQAREAFRAARSAGFENIGIDLIHALPGQTLLMWQSDLLQALSLAPDHLSVYGLTVEEGTPFAIQYDDERALPDEDLSADMFETADEFLTASGYEHYEIANYARPGFHSRHNSGYWQRDCYLGLGAGAHSLLRNKGYGVRFGNASDLNEYSTAIHESKSAGRDISVLTREEAMAEFMFLGLRMADGIDFKTFVSEFNIGISEVFGKELEELTSQGLLVTNAFNTRLSNRGMLLSNQVFSRFI